MKTLTLFSSLLIAGFSLAQCPNTGISPTAICQDITIYLNGAGAATITAADIDGGSTDDCGIVSFAASQTAFTCNDLTTAPANDLIITGVIDGPLVGGTPKAVELFVVNNIADLSQYGLGSANNGGGSDGQEFTFPADAVTAGSYIYIATEANEFTNFFGFAPDYTSGSATNINGDDAIELFFQTNVIDVFGDINLDGTSQPWEYLDGWAYRNNSTGPDGTSFVLGSWSFSGPNALDTETSNGTATTPFPIGSFAYPGPYQDPIPVALLVVDGEGNSDNCIALVTVKDTISPVADAASLTDLTDACSVSAPTAPTATDNCFGSINGVANVTFPITATGTTVVTWTYDDGNGNMATQTQNVIINDLTDPTAPALSPMAEECAADVAAPDVLVVTGEADNCSTPVVAFVSDVSDGASCPEVITRTYSVTDAAGNQILLTQTITVNDVTIPTASNPTAINVECSADVPAPDVLVVTDEADNCTAAPIVTFVTDVTDNNSCPETIVRTYNVADDCGNQITVIQIITVLDVSDPIEDVATLPDVNAECISTPVAPTATDNCDGSIDATPDVTFPITAIGTTVVTWTYTDNCSNSISQTQNVIITALDITVTQSGLTLTSNSTGGTYQWLDCNDSYAVISGETSQSFTTTTNGSYAVEITSGACVDTSICYVISGIGFLENDFGSALVVYPNPTSGQLTISLGGLFEDVTVQLKSLDGKMLSETIYQTAENIDLEISGADGLYLIDIKTEAGKTAVIKVLKK